MNVTCPRRNPSPRSSITYGGSTGSARPGMSGRHPSQRSGSGAWWSASSPALSLSPPGRDLRQHRTGDAVLQQALGRDQLDVRGPAAFLGRRRGPRLLAVVLVGEGRRRVRAHSCGLYAAPHRDVRDAVLDVVRAIAHEAEPGVPVEQVGLRVEHDLAVAGELERVLHERAARPVPRASRRRRHPPDTRRPVRVAQQAQRRRRPRRRASIHSCSADGSRSRPSSSGYGHSCSTTNTPVRSCRIR